MSSTGIQIHHTRTRHLQLPHSLQNASNSTRIPIHCQLSRRHDAPSSTGSSPQPSDPLIAHLRASAQYISSMSQFNAEWREISSHHPPASPSSQPVPHTLQQGRSSAHQTLSFEGPGGHEPRSPRCCCQLPREVDDGHLEVVYELYRRSPQPSEGCPSQVIPAYTPYGERQSGHFRCWSRCEVYWNPRDRMPFVVGREVCARQVPYY